MVRRTALIALPFFLWAMPHGLGLEIPLPFDTELGRKYRAELELLIVPPEKLPAGCWLARDIRTAPIYPALTNPQATENPQLIGFTALLMGPGQFDLENVSAAVTALYYDRDQSHEIGISALRFTNPDTASRSYQRLIASSPHQEDRLLLKGPLIIGVWHDEGVREEAFRAIESHIKKANLDLGSSED